MLWHERFGHLNFKYLEQLHNDKMVEGLPRLHNDKMVEGLPLIQTSNGVCSGCLVGKHPKKRYEFGKAHRAASILDLIHSDVAGPMPQHPLMVAVISSLVLMIVLGSVGYTS